MAGLSQFDYTQMLQLPYTGADVGNGAQRPAPPPRPVGGLVPVPFAQPGLQSVVPFTEPGAMVPYQPPARGVAPYVLEGEVIREAPAPRALPPGRVMANAPQPPNWGPPNPPVEPTANNGGGGRGTIRALHENVALPKPTPSSAANLTGRMLATPMMVPVAENVAPGLGMVGNIAGAYWDRPDLGISGAAKLGYEQAKFDEMTEEGRRKFFPQGRPVAPPKDETKSIKDIPSTLDPATRNEYPMFGPILGPTIEKIFQEPEGARRLREQEQRDSARQELVSGAIKEGKSPDQVQQMLADFDYQNNPTPPAYVSAIGENARLYVNPNQTSLPISITQQVPSDQRNAGQYPNSARQLENAAQLYPDAKSVLAAAQEESANRKRGFDNLALQGAAPSGSLDAGVMARTAATRTEPDGTQYEQRQYALPGGGEVSGWRAVDPNRPKGSFSVVPGLSDFEKRRYAELVGEERRQAAYQAGQGRQYDALLAKQAEQQVEAYKARMEQDSRNDDLEVKRATLDENRRQNNLTAQRDAETLRKGYIDSALTILNRPRPRLADLVEKYTKDNPNVGQKEIDVLAGALGRAGIASSDQETLKNTDPKLWPMQYFDKATGQVMVRKRDGTYAPISPDEAIKLNDDQEKAAILTNIARMTGSGQ